MRPKWLSIRQAMAAEATRGAEPTDADNTASVDERAGEQNARANDAEMRVALENGAMERLMHPDRDAGFLSADENAATRVAATAALRGKTEARAMPKTTPKPASKGEEEAVSREAAPADGRLLGVENCVGNILSGLEYIKAAGMSS